MELVVVTVPGYENLQILKRLCRGDLVLGLVRLKMNYVTIHFEFWHAENSLFPNHSHTGFAVFNFDEVVLAPLLEISYTTRTYRYPMQQWRDCLQRTGPCIKYSIETPRP